MEEDFAINKDNKEDFECLLKNHVYKHKLRRGVGGPPPEDCEVYLEYVMRSAENRVRIAYAEEPRLLRIPIARIIPVGLRVAVRSMLKNEVSHCFISHELGFGNEAISIDGDVNKTTTLKAFSNLLIKVRLVRFLVIETPRYEFGVSNSNFYKEEQMLKIREMYESGIENLALKQKHKALKCFSRCLYTLKRLKIDGKANPEDEELRKGTIFNVTLPAAQAALDIGYFGHAINLGRQALEIRPEDLEIRYITGCAYFAYGHYALARKHLQAASFGKPMNKAYKEKLVELENHMKLLTDHCYMVDETADYEDYAVSLMNKIREKKRVIQNNMKDYLIGKLKEDAERIEIGGGFSEKSLKAAAKKVNGHLTDNKMLRAVIVRNTLIVQYS